MNMPFCNGRRVCMLRRRTSACADSEGCCNSGLHHLHIDAGKANDQIASCPAHAQMHANVDARLVYTTCIFSQRHLHVHTQRHPNMFILVHPHILACGQTSINTRIFIPTPIYPDLHISTHRLPAKTHSEDTKTTTTTTTSTTTKTTSHDDDDLHDQHDDHNDQDHQNHHMGPRGSRRP